MALVMGLLGFEPFEFNGITVLKDTINATTTLNLYDNYQGYHNYDAPFIQHHIPAKFLLDTIILITTHITISNLNTMKSLKSIFAILAIATLSFGCASVTDASLNDADQPDTEITADDAVFNGGNEMDPVIEKPW
ncbi:hypothetical protein SAMN06265219_10940 [Gracilimonas mengyeensis]|uniref:Uncharacterized protein n=2 Tax=Gracilimonas mengyeensis TaxID=1302730 RepID=A0A521DR92_9BACT|nr:hypothetical protein SAMN06265219_10940 [Gracilimonas mengyeensis]